MTTKRVLDMGVSAFLLLALLPVAIVISIAIAVTMGTPVMFRQIRPGWRRKSLSMLKFRTMSNRTDANGDLLPDEERLTPLGRFLRDTSLDELPQLINVLLGEMSLIGPRPLLERYVSGCTPEQSRRFDVRPGITGWAQIHGRKALDYDRRFEYDVWYVDHQSLLFDLKILFATLLIVLKQDGTVETGEVSPEPAYQYSQSGELSQASVTGYQMVSHVDHVRPLYIPETVSLRTPRVQPAENPRIV